MSSPQPLPAMTTAAPRSDPGGAVRCACGTIFETSDKMDMPLILATYEEHLKFCSAAAPRTYPERSVMAQVADAIFGSVFSFPGIIIIGMITGMLITIYS